MPLIEQDGSGPTAELIWRVSISENINEKVVDCIKTGL